MILAVSFQAALVTAGVDKKTKLGKEAERTLTVAAKYIKEQTKLDEKVIKEDLVIIRMTIPALQIQRLDDRDKMSEENATELAAQIWKHLRGIKSAAKESIALGSSKDEITKKILLDAAKRYGKLIVTSDPTGGSVELNKIKWGETKTDGWEQAGTYPITVSKEGFVSKEDEVKIVAKRSTEYNAKLKKDK
jgi:hypothetical protein